MTKWLAWKWIWTWARRWVAEEIQSWALESTGTTEKNGTVQPLGKKMGGQGSLFFILFLHFVVCRERISTNLCSYRQIYLPLSSGSQSSFVQFEIRRTGAEFVRNAFRFDLKSKKSPNARSTHKYIHKITEKNAETDCQQLRLLLQFCICLLKYVV